MKGTTVLNPRDRVTARVGGLSLLLLARFVWEEPGPLIPGPGWLALWAWGTLLGATVLTIHVGLGLAVWPGEYVA